MSFYRVELHSHCQGDPQDRYIAHTIFEHIDRAKKVGLDAIAITWHRRICCDPIATQYARERGILLISGMEAEINRGHLLVLNLAEGDLPGRTSWDEVRALRRRKPDVLVIAPHLFYLNHSCLGYQANPHVDCIDAVEWCMFDVAWLPRRINPNLRAARWAAEHQKPLIACSDAHSLAAIGENASTIVADALTPESLTTVIRSGHVTFQKRRLTVPQMAYHINETFSSQPWHYRTWGRKL